MLGYLIVFTLNSIATLREVVLVCAIVIMGFGGNAEAQVNLCRSALLLGSDKKVNPELMKTFSSFDEGDEIPEVLLERYGVNEVAKAVVQRLRDVELKYPEALGLPDETAIVDLAHETDLILFFNPELFPAIIANGFLNKHEVARPGDFYQKVRLEIEDSFTRFKLGASQLAKKLRPKYLLLNVRAGVDLSNKIHDGSGYGKVGAVMKSSVLNRATWTESDSYNIYFYRVFSLKAALKFRGTFQRGNLPMEGTGDTYFEAQVYGTLGVDDVAYYLVEKPQLAEFLKVQNKPIYLTRQVERNGRLVYEKGDLLFAGHESSALPLDSSTFKP